MPGGFLLVLSLVAPVAGVLLAFAVGGRRVEGIALSIMPTGLTQVTLPSLTTTGVFTFDRSSSFGGSGSTVRRCRIQFSTAFH